VGALGQDVRHALTALRRDVGFTAVTVVTLAVGLGANTTVFSVLRSVLWAPLPYSEPAALAMLWTRIAEEGLEEATSAYANVEDWRAQTGSFSDLATFDPTTLTLTDGEWPEQASGVLASSNLFAVLGVGPALGRGFTEAEEERRVPVAVLSHDLWERRFGASPDAVGRTVEVSGVPFEVVGVMPEGFAFPGSDEDLWLPQTVQSDWDARVDRRGTDSWRVLGRLGPDVSIEQAQADMDGIAARLAEAFPGVNAGLGIYVEPLHDHVAGYSTRVALWTLFGAVGLLLMIALANAGHLVLARGIRRSRDLSMHVVLGATTTRLLRLTLGESLVLAAVAGLLGVSLASVALRALVALAPADLPRLDEIRLDASALAYAAALCVVVAIALGVLLALGLSRRVLRDGWSAGRIGSGPRPRLARDALIVFQLAMATVLVFGADLLVRSFLQVGRVEPGFQAEDVWMANLSVASASDRMSVYERVVERVEALPGVRAAGIVEDLFISGAPSRTLTVEGRPPSESVPEEIRVDAVAGDFFGTLGVSLRAGRGFSSLDDARAVPVAIVNEVMARRFWRGESPIGRRFRIGPAGIGSPWIEVVGVVGDMRRQGLETAPIAQVFRPYAQEPSRNMNLLVRTDAPVPELAALVRATVTEIDGTVPVYGVTTVTEAMGRYLVQRTFQTSLLGLFTAIALVLAAGGIYGLMQFSVSQRTQELATRLAVGATGRRLMLMVLGRAAVLAALGLAAGALAAAWLADAFSALLFEVGGRVQTLGVSSAVLLLTAVAASYVPARRAAATDPMRSLRHR